MSPTIISESTRRRLTATLFVSQGLFGAAQIASFTTMSIIAAQLSGGELAAGVPSTLSMLGRAVAGYPIGWLMDRYGRRFGLAFGYLIAVVGAVLTVLGITEQSFLIFCGGSALLGFGRGSSEQTRYTAADVQPAALRARAISQIVLAGTFGAIVGPLLVEPSQSLVTIWGLPADVGPYLIGAILVLTTFVMTVALLRPDPMLVAKALNPTPATPHPTTSTRSLRYLLTSSTQRLALASLIVSQLVMTMIMVITPLHMSHQHHGVHEISWVIMAHTIGMFGLSFVTGRLVERFGPYAVILLGGLILAVSAILAPIAGGVVFLAIALFLLGLGWNLCFIAGSSLMALGLSPDERGKAQGASEGLVALAAGTGSLSTGALFANGGMTAVAMVGLAVTLAFFAASVWAAQQRRAQATVE